MFDFIIKSGFLWEHDYLPFIFARRGRRRAPRTKILGKSLKKNGFTLAPSRAGEERYLLDETAPCITRKPISFLGYHDRYTASRSGISFSSSNSPQSEPHRVSAFSPAFLLSRSNHALMPSSRNAQPEKRGTLQLLVYAQEEGRDKWARLGRA